MTSQGFDPSTYQFRSNRSPTGLSKRSQSNLQIPGKSEINLKVSFKVRVYIAPARIHIAMAANRSASRSRALFYNYKIKHFFKCISSKRLYLVQFIFKITLFLRSVGRQMFISKSYFFHRKNNLSSLEKKSQHRT